MRGHQKQIGRSVSSTSKSPLCILNKLLQDKKGHRNILKILNKSQFSLRSFVRQKLIISSDQALMSTGIPEKTKYHMRSPHSVLDSFVLKQEAEASSERKKLPVGAQRSTKSSSNTLVGLLQMRQQGMEITARKTPGGQYNRKAL